MLLCAPLRASTIVDTLWEDVTYSIQTGEFDAALATLAEISIHPGQKGNALAKAAEIYIELGKTEEAARILEELITIPGHEDAANLLVKLRYKEGSTEALIKLHRLHLPVTWDASSSQLIRRAYLESTGMVPDDAPEAGLPTEEPNRLQATLSATWGAARYMPFPDDSGTKDSEYESEVSLRLSYPVRTDCDLYSRISLRDERSEKHPDSFHAYRAELLRLQLGAKWEAPYDVDIELELGGVFTEAEDYHDIDQDDPDPAWLASGSIAKTWNEHTLKLGAYRDMFGVPDYTGYDIEEMDVQFAECELALRSGLKLNGALRRVRFSGGADDYDMVSGILTYYPEAQPALSLNAGCRHEFRDRDEDILIGGLDWMQRLPGNTIGFFSTYYYANTITHEHEVLAQIVLTGGKRMGHLLFGCLCRNELNVDKRTSLQFFIKLL